METTDDTPPETTPEEGSAPAAEGEPEASAGPEEAGEAGAATADPEAEAAPAADAEAAAAEQPSTADAGGQEGGGGGEAAETGEAEGSGGPADADGAAEAPPPELPVGEAAAEGGEGLEAEAEAGAGAAGDAIAEAGEAAAQLPAGEEGGPTAERELGGDKENESAAEGTGAEAEAAAKLPPRPPPKKKQPPVKGFWESQGSEAEVEQLQVTCSRPLLQMVVQRPRREMGQACQLADRAAHELHRSNDNEQRPTIRDPNFDLQRLELDIGVQAVPETSEAAVQATGQRPRPGSMQYQPQGLPNSTKAKLLQSDVMAAFLKKAAPLYEEALVQNEITNIFRDDFAELGEDDVSSARRGNMIAEHQSFTDLTYSKNKVVSTIRWHPHQKGVVAVACIENWTHAQRVEVAGHPGRAAVLIWSFRDPIHPQYVLESPFEVFCFEFNPVQPDLIIGGCYNGQVVVWDVSTEHDRISKAKSAEREESSDEHAIPVVRHKFISTVDSSHTSVVNALTWLPGIEITKDGKVVKDKESEGQCSFFATTAADGKIMFWDVRVERLAKRGRRQEDLQDLIWKATYIVPLLSLEGGDCACTCFSFDRTRRERGEIYVGSFDGEVLYADFIAPDGEEHPDYSKWMVAAHSGPVMALERSPFFSDIIMSIADWTFLIWKEGISSPIFRSPFAQDYYTAGCWSPSRPAVLYLTMQNGTLEVWDLLDRTHEPAITTTISSGSLASISFNTNASRSKTSNQMLAIGDSAGVLHIMDLPPTLRRPVHQEAALVSTLLQRQQSCLQDIESRKGMREKIAKQQEDARKLAAEEEERRKAAAESGKAEGTGGGGSAAGSGMEWDEQAEKDYQELEQKFKVQLGLVDENGDPINPDAS